MGQKGKCENDGREAPTIEGVAEAEKKRKEGRFERMIEGWKCERVGRDEERKE